MLKHYVVAALLSASVFGISALPASAAFSQTDCSYARMLLDQGAGAQGGSHYNAFAATVQQCR